MAVTGVGHVDYFLANPGRVPSRSTTANRRETLPAMNTPSIEHVLAIVSEQNPGAGIPFGWAHRISDTYRLAALHAVFESLSGRVLDFGCGAKPYERPLRHVRIDSW